jgi:bifunctional DNase/RNase
MIPVEVVNVALLNKRFVIFLKSSIDKRALPIFVDDQQAQSIVIQINKVEVPRPLTHDLFKTVLDSLECSMVRIEISDIIEDTFYARIVLDFKGKPLDFDARPSDAICLALRFSAPIFVDDTVMEKAGIVLAEDEESTLQQKSPDNSAPEEQIELSSLERIKMQLENAIQEERYEDAAVLRDQLKKHTSVN